MLESGLLDDMDDDTLSDLAKAIGEQQGKKLSVSRSQILVKKAMETHKEWLALQDIPTPRVRQPWKWKPRSPAMSPVDTITPTRRRGRATPSPLTSPELQAVRSSSAVDDIFTMDDDPSSPSAASGSTTPKISRPGSHCGLAARSRGRARLEIYRRGSAKVSGGRGLLRFCLTSSDNCIRVDLRSIMEAQATRTPGRPAPIRPATPGGVLGSTERRPIPGSSPVLTPSKGPSLTGRTPPTSSAPWRPVDNRKTSLSTVQAQQAGGGPSTSSANPILSTPGRPAGTQASPVVNASKVITPVRLQPAPPGVQRKASYVSQRVTT
jgi:hypothetical protein